MSTASRKRFVGCGPAFWLNFFLALCHSLASSGWSIPYPCLHPQLLEVRALFQRVALSVQPLQKEPQNSLMFLCKYSWALFQTPVCFICFTVSYKSTLSGCLCLPSTGKVVAQRYEASVFYRPNLRLCRSVSPATVQWLRNRSCDSQPDGTFIRGDSRWAWWRQSWENQVRSYYRTCPFCPLCHVLSHACRAPSCRVNDRCAVQKASWSCCMSQIQDGLA